MFQDKGVQIICKHCGKKAMSTDFILDPVYKMMVCKNCSKDRQLKENPIIKTQQTFPPSKPAVAVQTSSQTKTMTRPAIAHTNMITGQKTITTNQKKTINSGTEKQKKKCCKCGFSYTYNTDKNYPMNCPNCGTASLAPGRFY